MLREKQNLRQDWKLQSASVTGYEHIRRAHALDPKLNTPQALFLHKWH